MDGYGKRILVVDDDAGWRALLEAQLEQEGFAVQKASGGLEGLGEMRKRRFDVVIADAHMPGFIGREFAGFCRVGWPDTPLILLTGDLNYVAYSADELDAAACVCKPGNATMLLSVLRTVTQLLAREQSIFPMVEMKH